MKEKVLFFLLLTMMPAMVAAESDTYLEASNRGVAYLASQLQENGSYGATIIDLAAYYKSPYLFLIAGKLEEANRVTDYIKEAFLRNNGDVTTTTGLKSADAAFEEYYGYTNTWISIGTQKLGRFDVSYPTWSFLDDFYHKKLGGFTTRGPCQHGKNNEIDILTTAHMGLASLYRGDLKRAVNAGNLLARFYAKQPDLDTGFYLRMDDKGKLLTSFPDDAAIFYMVSTTESFQAYFMIGYPIAFLGKLYLATDDIRHLMAARNYLDFAMRIQGNLRSFYFSHKLGWGAAVVANITGESDYAKLARDIGDYLVSIQDPSGAWLTDQPYYTSLDQTAEISIWLREIHAELNARQLYIP